MKVLTIIGTRPEAIKMAPVLRALRARPGVTSLLATTGQHRDLIQAPLHFFGITPDYQLKLGFPDQDPLSFVGRAVPELEWLIGAVRPDRVIVQGDTASAMAGAEAAASLSIPVTHVEAGLRSHADLPWPEEQFRRTIDSLSDLLLAPTPLAAGNLRAERRTGAVHVTGNSGIDALHFVMAILARDEALYRTCDALLPSHRSFVLVTLHRRENVGRGAAALCGALLDIAAAGRIEIVLPLHPNPGLANPIREALGRHARIHLLPAQDPPNMVRLMQRSRLILTDSGGIQEEAPSLGKAVLVLRDVTERPEGVAAGLAKLVRLERDAIVAAVGAALAEPAEDRRTSWNPYGDGRAAERIVAALLGEPFAPFRPGAPNLTASPVQFATS